MASSQNKAFRRKLTSAIAERAERICFNLSDKVTDVFVENARLRLEDRATPKDGISQALIERVKNNITRQESKSEGASYIVSVKGDPEGLFMFLEYGTGLTGGTFPHPESGQIGWDYMVNFDNPKIYKWYKDDMGWFFSADKATYIDENDEYPIVEYRTRGLADEQVGPYIRNGKLVNKKGYHRVRPYVLNGIQLETVFSHGLYPLMYFYDTKQQIRDILKKASQMSKSSKVKPKDIDALIEAERGKV